MVATRLFRGTFRVRAMCKRIAGDKDLGSGMQRGKDHGSCSGFFGPSFTGAAVGGKELLPVFLQGSFFYTLRSWRLIQVESGS